MTVYNKNFQVKALNEKGEFEAVIATLNTVDHDGDVTLPGAFGKQDVQILPAHDNWAPSMGKATISEDGDKVIAKGKFNLDVSIARDWYASIKFDAENGTPLQEYSYGFRIKESSEETREGERVRILEKLDVFEISPVLKGAGIGTGTLAVKSFGTHKTDTDEGLWDRLAMLHRVRVNESEKYYEGLFACRAGRTWHLPHHLVDEKGDLGAANVRACLIGIAHLNDIFGPCPLDEKARKAAYEHLASHLKDAGMDAPPLADVGLSHSPSIKLAEQIQFALWDVEAGIARARDVLALRKKEGRALGSDATANIGNMKDSLADLLEVAHSLAEVDDENVVEKQIADYQMREAKRRGLTL